MKDLKDLKKNDITFHIKKQIEEELQKNYKKDKKEYNIKNKIENIIKKMIGKIKVNKNNKEKYFFMLEKFIDNKNVILSFEETKIIEDVIDQTRNNKDLEKKISKIILNTDLKKIIKENMTNYEIMDLFLDIFKNVKKKYISNNKKDFNKNLLKYNEDEYLFNLNFNFYTLKTNEIKYILNKTKDITEIPLKKEIINKLFNHSLKNPNLLNNIFKEIKLLNEEKITQCFRENIINILDFEYDFYNRTKKIYKFQELKNKLLLLYNEKDVNEYINFLINQEIEFIKVSIKNGDINKANKHINILSKTLEGNENIEINIVFD